MGGVKVAVYLLGVAIVGVILASAISSISYAIANHRAFCLELAAFVVFIILSYVFGGE